ncbi:Cilia- and flagella-associated protein 53 [Chytriomyces hyalinus]|nr:Cilia- and flagella-associated protein 53 [Chytriomyces hyalinus]KAJ3248562.1 Cilia- and flagella-associated protein 53 [Chytriomyces hyalinus]
MALLGESLSGMRTRRNVRNSDYLIVNRRREEEQRNQMHDVTNYYAKTDLQSSFEETTSRTIKRNQLYRRVEELRGEELSALESRRESLRALLQSDDEKYAQELLEAEETRETRVEKMKARMEELKSKRESERKKIVDEKLLQRWRNECDELRTIESKQFLKRVTVARGEQLVEHAEQRKVEQEEKKYYDLLWEQDRQKKIAREIAETTKFKEMNAITVAMLNNQLMLLREQQAEEERLKKEEAELMHQEMEMRKTEDERNKRRKEEEQRIIRAELDKFNSLRLQARSAEIQKSLALDIQIVNDVLAVEKADIAAKTRRRAELRKEMQMYRDHLMEQKRLENERDREIERLQKADSEKLWRQRAEKWQKEQKARDKLMVEVLAGRRSQLKLKLEQNRFKQEQTRLEREHILRQIEIANQVEALDKERKSALVKSYRDSLEAQVESVEEKKRDFQRLDAREALALKIAEQKYQELLDIETQRVKSDIGRNGHLIEQS